MRQFFPISCAAGETFLGRVSEIKQMSRELEAGKHIVMVAPRRYGVTSLVRRILDDNAILDFELNFALTLDEDGFVQRILVAIAKLLSALDSRIDSTFKIVSEELRQREIDCSLRLISDLELQLIPGSAFVWQNNLPSLFSVLEVLLAKVERRVALVIESIASLNRLRQSESMYQVLEAVTQRTKNINFIFTDGYSTELMRYVSNIEVLMLGRLSRDDYWQYLDMVAHRTWGEELDSEIFTAIMSLTEYHPDTVYRLCGRIWHVSPDRQPPRQLVHDCWLQLIAESRKDICERLNTLSPGLLKVLLMIANGKHKELTGKVAQRELDLTSGAIVYALKNLENMHYIEPVSNKSYRVIEPITRAVLRYIYS